MSCRCGRHKTPQGCAGARALAAMPPEVKVRKPSGRPKASKRTGPLCACGCGRRCFPRSRWASQPCVPPAARSAAMREGWARASARRRAERFRADIDRLLVKGRIGRLDLIAFAHNLYERGYAACLGRERRQRSAAA